MEDSEWDKSQKSPKDHDQVSDPRRGMTPTDGPGKLKSMEKNYLQRIDRQRGGNPSPKPKLTGRAAGTAS